MVLDLYLLRHGETERNVNYAGVIGGRSSSLPLTERGVAQAAALGERLAREGVSFDYVYSSTAERASRTADIACAKLGVSPSRIIREPQLEEMFQGEWEGKPRAECYTPDHIMRMNTDPWHAKAPGGESQYDVEKRGLAWLRRELLHKDGVAGVFAHGLVVKCILRGILDSDPALTYRIAIDNCSITQMHYAAEGRHPGWHLLRINDGAHLNDIGHVPVRHA